MRTAIVLGTFICLLQDACSCGCNARTATAPLPTSTGTLRGDAAALPLKSELSTQLSQPKELPEDDLQWPVIEGPDDVIIPAMSVLTKAEISTFRDAGLGTQWLAVSKADRPRAIQILSAHPPFVGHLITSDPEPNDSTPEPQSGARK